VRRVSAPANVEKGNRCSGLKINNNKENSEKNQGGGWGGEKYSIPEKGVGSRLWFDTRLRGKESEETTSHFLLAVIGRTN